MVVLRPRPGYGDLADTSARAMTALAIARGLLRSMPAVHQIELLWDAWSRGDGIAFLQTLLPIIADIGSLQWFRQGYQALSLGSLLSMILPPTFALAASEISRRQVVRTAAFLPGYSLPPGILTRSSGFRSITQPSDRSVSVTNEAEAALAQRVMMIRLSEEELEDS